MVEEKCTKKNGSKEFIAKYGAVLIGGLRWLYELAIGLIGELHR